MNRVHRLYCLRRSGWSWLADRLIDNSNSSRTDREQLAGDLKRLRDWTKSSVATRREHLPHGYRREKSAVLADADQAFRKMARATQP